MSDRCLQHAGINFLYIRLLPGHVSIRKRGDAAKKFLITGNWGPHLGFV